MSVGRVIMDGDAIEVAGRFETADEIADLVDRLWTAFYVINPAAPEPDSAGEAEKPIDLPELPRRAAVMAGLDPAIHESPAERHDVEGLAVVVTPSQPPQDCVTQDAAAFARLSPSERRCVMLWRTHRNAGAVAKQMEISPNSVSVYLSNARRKGIQI